MVCAKQAFVLLKGALGNFNVVLETTSLTTRLLLKRNDWVAQDDSAVPDVRMRNKSALHKSELKKSGALSKRRCQCVPVEWCPNCHSPGQEVLKNFRTGSQLLRMLEESWIRLLRILQPANSFAHPLQMQHKALSQTQAPKRPHL